MSEEAPPQEVIEICPQCRAELPRGPVAACPYCGTRLVRPRPAAQPWSEGISGMVHLPPAVLERMAGYEYRSPATLGGLPLLHVAQGIDPQTGRPRVARGVIAIGNVAFGVVAVGGVAVGGVAIGGLAVGVVALAGVAVGLAALGGMALAAWLALGGLAISAQYAVGGLALAPHALGGNVQDPVLLRWVEGIFGPIE